MTHPDTDYYSLGRGVLSIAEWIDATPGTYQDVGNCSRLEINLTEETLDHYSSRSNRKTKDKSVTLQVGYTITFDLDEISQANLARFLHGAITGDVIAGLQGVDKRYAVKFITDNAAGLNYTYEFWKVKLSPSGNLALIGDEWQTLSFTAEGESDEANHATAPYFQVTLVTGT
jgi:hypothetical protein